MNIEKIWTDFNQENTFSGVFAVTGENGILFEKSCGYRNRSEKLPNNIDTAFGIASGTKLVTGLAICKLIDTGRLSLEAKLWDLLPYDLGQIDKSVSVFHLLTHTSGIGDYLDEESPDSYAQEQELCRKYPVYLWERLEYYLKMITPLPPKFEPGARFGYSNAGYIMLGLVIEATTGIQYQQYVTNEIIRPLNLKHTGFYRMDSLPSNTALGYLDDFPTQSRTNIFSLPVIGGSDGGLFTCAQDLDTLWRSLFAGKILSKNMLQTFLTPHVTRSPGKTYGLGVYLHETTNGTAYYAVGGDFGVDFHTAYFPTQKITTTTLSNTNQNTYPLLNKIFSTLFPSPQYS